VKQKRHIGLLDSTMIGIGGIVGGGIFALAGIAFKVTGPGAILAFALNGIIAFIVVFSFAEMSAAFPESGGPYVFAKKILSVQSAFAIGWIVWFASIMAAVLYALGFASYTELAIERLCSLSFGYVPNFLDSQWLKAGLAVCSTVFYASGLLRESGGTVQWENIGKLLVFALLIAGGLWALFHGNTSEHLQSLTPLFPAGGKGILLAMGYTFIALQGFDLIPAVAGEVCSPEKNVPRAMKLSLAIALVVYLPLLFVISTVGMQHGKTVSVANSEKFFALAVQRYLGSVGFWLVIVGAVLSMLSALKANLFAASRVIFSMACDRTLPHQLRQTHKKSGKPGMAVIASAFTVAIFLFAIPNLEAAGAAASLVFLISFTMVQCMSILSRRRIGKENMPYKAPWFPFFPVFGSIACMALAVFQGIAVPSAGLIVIAWLGVGGVLFLFIFAPRAMVFDASAEAHDPLLSHTRGRNPLVLVPIANPNSAESMVTVANAIAPPNIGRVLLLSVVSTKKAWSPKTPPQQLIDAQKVLQEALMTSTSIGLSPEALVTMSKKPWAEIGRVARIHRCESLLIGFSKFTEKFMETNLERLISAVDSNVIILRVPHKWRVREVKKVLVPLGGQGAHEILRARLLSSLYRMTKPEITFLRIVPENTSEREYKRIHRALLRFAEDESPGIPRTEIIRSDNVLDNIVRFSQKNDLTVLGVQRLGPQKKVFGNIVLKIAKNFSGPLIMISHRK